MNCAKLDFFYYKYKQTKGNLLNYVRQNEKNLLCAMNHKMSVNLGFVSIIFDSLAIL